MREREMISRRAITGLRFRGCLDDDDDDDDDELGLV